MVRDTNEQIILQNFYTSLTQLAPIFKVEETHYQNLFWQFFPVTLILELYWWKFDLSCHYENILLGTDHVVVLINYS